MKTKHKKMSSKDFIRKVKHFYPHIIDWAYKQLGEEWKVIDDPVVMSASIISLLVVGKNRTIPLWSLYKEMGVSHGKLSRMNYKAYNWIKKNEELVLLRML